MVLKPATTGLNFFRGSPPSGLPPPSIGGPQPGYFPLHCDLLGIRPSGFGPAFLETKGTPPRALPPYEQAPFPGVVPWNPPGLESGIGKQVEKQNWALAPRPLERILKDRAQQDEVTRVFPCQEVLSKHGLGMTWPWKGS